VEALIKHHFQPVTRHHHGVHISWRGSDAPPHLEWWLRWASRRRIPAFLKLARPVRANRERILAAVELKLETRSSRGSTPRFDSSITVASDTTRPRPSSPWSISAVVGSPSNYLRRVAPDDQKSPTQTRGEPQVYVMSIAPAMDLDLLCSDTQASHPSRPRPRTSYTCRTDLPYEIFGFDQHNIRAGSLRNSFVGKHRRR
jgi:hypothetical protein